MRCTASHLHTCIALVAAGLGVAYRRLIAPMHRLELAIVYRRDDPSEVPRAFVAGKVSVLACETAERRAPARAG